MTRATASTVLLLEPHQDSAAMFAEVLRWAGFRVQASNDGRIPGHRAPDVVVVGVRSCDQPVQPVMAAGHCVPAIAITSDPRDTDQADALGYASVLLRPVDPAVLISEVRRVVRLSRHSTPGAA